jgi:hypothetical protein
MAKTAKSGRSRDRSAAAAAVAVLPEALILWDILIRLPAKDLLRCRAWRRLTTAADFLLAHHRWQPSLPLVFFLAVPSWLRNDRGDAAFDALDLRRRPTKRQPVLRFNDNTQGCTFEVCVSCDGLILLSASNGRFYICNPATRQWAALPKLNFANVAGMYSHSSTGEYRVLYWTPARTSDALDTVYYVLTVGSSAEPRCIGQPIASSSVKLFVGGGLESLSCNRYAPVLLHDCLHWIELRREQQQEAIVIFDTVREPFRLKRYPTELHQSNLYLLEMNGTLGISWPAK